MISIIPGPGDKVKNKTNIVLHQRNLKIMALVLNFTVLCCLVCDMMLFNHRHVVDVV